MKMHKSFIVLMFLVGLTFETEFIDVVERGDLYSVQEMLRKNRNLVGEIDEAGNTALVYAAWKGHTKIVEFLIESDANVNHAGKFGTTALSAAAVEGHADPVKFLINARADVNLGSDDGYTPLIDAACGNWVEVVAILIEAGADTKRALDWAVSYSHRGAVELLVLSGANTTGIRDNGMIESAVRKKLNIEFSVFSSFAQALHDDYSDLIAVVRETITLAQM